MVAVVALLLVAFAGPAAAGEVKGPPGQDGAEGGPTPVAEYRAKSICSFSGLNDAIPGDGPFPEFTQTQSYGTFLNMFQKPPFNLTFREAKALLPSPGVACNPTAEFEE
jgi:hypothetical protein